MYSSVKQNYNLTTTVRLIIYVGLPLVTHEYTPEVLGAGLEDREVQPV